MTYRKPRAQLVKLVEVLLKRVMDKGQDVRIVDKTWQRFIFFSFDSGVIAIRIRGWQVTNNRGRSRAAGTSRSIERDEMCPMVDIEVHYIIITDNANNPFIGFSFASVYRAIRHSMNLQLLSLTLA